MLDQLPQVSSVHRRRLVKRRVVALIVLMALGASLSLPSAVSATGETVCQSGGTSLAQQNGALAAVEIGARANIEGQAIPLCIFGGTFYPSGAFHWAAVGNLNDPAGRDIVQIGYGRCANTNNNLGLGTLCNGNFYAYWAWGGACPGDVDGSLPGVGPVPIRIGPALANPPPTRNYYVLRLLVNGVSTYQGFVDGALLTGLNALGQNVSASIPASEVCWNGDNSANRIVSWFGETWNPGDSMGGWVGATANNLDHTTIRYSVNTGWLSPNFSFPATCVNQQFFPPYRCKKTAADQLFITTTR